jgi:hypothetical protein
MARPNPRAILSASLSYLRKNPDEVVRAAVNAATLRFGVPLAALRYLAKEIPGGKKAPREVQISAAPPAIRFSAIVDAMGTDVRASAAIRIEDVNITPEQMRVVIRLRDVKLELVGEAESPIATLIKSGALDLSKPGNLVKFIPKRPPAIVEAENDRIVLDLMKVPKLAKNPRVRRALEVITPMVGIGAIETDRDHLYVRLRTQRTGVMASFTALLNR